MVALGTSTCFHLKGTFGKERLISAHSCNVEFALARITFYENNMLIGQETKFLLSALTGVRMKGVEFRKNPIKSWINFWLLERLREARDRSRDRNERHGQSRLEQSGKRSGIDYPTK